VGEIVAELTPSGLRLIRDEKKGDSGYAHNQREYDFSPVLRIETPQFCARDIL
jgi:hypothetical protein